MGAIGSETQNKTLPTLIDEYRQYRDDLQSGRQPSGYVWGDALPSLNRLMPIVPGRVYGVGGLRGHGKTWVAVQVADENLKAGVPVLMFSLEMQIYDVLERIVARQTKISSDNIRKKEHNETVEATLAELRTAPLTLVDEAVPNTKFVEDVLRNWKANLDENGGLVVIDFLQRIKYERHLESDVAHQREVAYHVAHLAKSYNVAVVVLMQLNKAATHDGISQDNVEGAGAQVQSVDAMILLNPAKKANGSTVELTLQIEKHRHGVSNQSIQCVADFRCGRIGEKDKIQREEPPEPTIAPWR